jgi:hypothetical protein
MDVEISAGGRTVRVTGAPDLDSVYTLWQKTATPDQPGPAFGFTAPTSPQHDHDRGRLTGTGHRPVVR